MNPHATRQPEEADRLLQERRPAQHRLHQVDLQIRPGDRQNEAGQARATAHIHDSGIHRQICAQGGAVQQMPRPQPWHLARAEQTPHHPGVCELIGEPYGDVAARTEYRGGGARDVRIREFGVDLRAAHGTHVTD